MTMPTATRIVRSVSFYPLTTFWITASVFMVLVAEKFLTLVQGLIMTALTALLALVYGLHRELKTVHALVNGQRTELLARIDQLVDLLKSSGVVVPPTGDREQLARDQASGMKRRWND